MGANSTAFTVLGSGTGSTPFFQSASAGGSGNDGWKRIRVSYHPAFSEEPAKIQIPGFHDRDDPDDAFPLMPEETVFFEGVIEEMYGYTDSGSAYIKFTVEKVGPPRR